MGQVLVSALGMRQKKNPSSSGAYIQIGLCVLLGVGGQGWAINR